MAYSTLRLQLSTLRMSSASVFPNGCERAGCVSAKQVRHKSSVINWYSYRAVLWSWQQTHDCSSQESVRYLYGITVASWAGRLLNGENNFLYGRNECHASLGWVTWRRWHISVRATRSCRVAPDYKMSFVQRWSAQFNCSAQAIRTINIITP